MSTISLFQMPSMENEELKRLFAFLVPAWLDAACIACGYADQQPIAIIATGSDELAVALKGFTTGVQPLVIADLPQVKYHLTGNTSLWPVKSPEHGSSVV